MSAGNRPLILSPVFVMIIMLLETINQTESFVDMVSHM